MLMPYDAPKDNTVFAALVVEHVRDGIVLTDARGLVVWINPAFTRMSGYDLADIRGRRPGDVLQGPLTTPESRTALAGAIRERVARTVEIVNYSRAGHAYIAQIDLAPIFDADGKLSYFVAIQRDVTREHGLAQESTDFKAYRKALDQQAIVSVTDARGRITYANGKFCAISGYSAEELIGKTHRIVNSGTHEPGFFRDMWAKICTGQTWHGEVCNRTKDGSLYWVDTTVVPVHDTNGDIVRYVSTRYAISERKLAEAELRRIAEVDALTGMANRTRFNHDLRTHLAAAQAGQGRNGGLVIMFDLDHFKDLNDTLGHNAGDLLLKEIGRRLLSFVGPGCVVSRLGGDEFAALIPDEFIGFDEQAFMRALHQFAGAAVALNDTLYVPSFSMGVTRYPGDAGTVEELMINADMALYEAKRNGRNQWCFFDPNVRTKLEYRSHLKAVLLQAIESDLFQIALQPYCDLSTGAHAGFEVLARLMHHGKPVPPDHFIPLAEDLGLIAPIGRVVRQKAFEARRRMVIMGLDPGQIAINVAALEFREATFVEDLLAALAVYGMQPGDLTVEITETALIGRSTEKVAQALVQLQARGVAVALDDFGTGFSSLSHLREFNVNKIKIDKSFVTHLETNQSDRVLVDGLIALARRLGLRVVAEGVETEGQRDYLRQCGCDYLQGYLHARPLSVDEALRFLAERLAGLEMAVSNSG